MACRFLVIAMAVGLVPACKKKASSPPEPVAADLGAKSPAGIPPVTEPDLDYPTRRAELLRRGDPTMMQAAPVVPVVPGRSDTNPPAVAGDLIKVVARDVMTVGPIRVDLSAGTAELPATVSTPNGPLEYIAVGEGGKAYESLFTVEATGVELRLALTLLGYQGTVPDAEGRVPTPTSADTVLVALRVGDRERPLAELLLDQRTGTALPDAAWQVIGFRDVDRTAALRTADFMTLVPRDRLAPLRLSVNAGNPYAAGQGWSVDAKALPPVGGAVVLIVRRRPEALPRSRRGAR